LDFGWGEGCGLARIAGWLFFYLKSEI